MTTKRTNRTLDIGGAPTAPAANGTALSQPGSVRVAFDGAQLVESVNGGAFAPISGGGGSDPLVGRTLFVDSTYGNDGTAVPNNLNQPYATIAAAITAAGVGDVLKLAPGSYIETNLTLPDNVGLVGDDWQTTTIGDPVALTTTVTMGDGCQITQCRILAPNQLGEAAVKHVSGTGALNTVDIQGDGLNGQGSGVRKESAGKLIGSNVRFEQGGMRACMEVVSGVLSLDDTHCPGSAGTIDAFLLATGTGRFQGQGFNIGNPNVGNAIELNDTATVILYSPNVFNCQNGLAILADGVSYRSTGGAFDNLSGATVFVDPALTGVGTTVEVLSAVLEPLFSFPPAAAINTQFAVDFAQLESNLRDPELRIIGQDQSLGFPELGSGLTVGRGSPFSEGIKVVTSDVTGSGGFVDVTTEAASRDSSTFTFQDITAGHCIYLTTLRQDGAGLPLKHFGCLVNQTTGSTGGSYILEYYDGGAGGWVNAGYQATSEQELYNYADQVFLRSSSVESIQYGIDENTNWGAQTIDGVSSYWFRWRIVSDLLTLPQFERVRLEESAAAINQLGQYKARGLAKWRRDLFSNSGILGRVQGGGVASTNVAVGTGAGLPTNWTAEYRDAYLNSLGDAVSFQFRLPSGICTAFPLTFKTSIIVDGAQPLTTGAELTLSVLPLQTAGVAIADPAGAIVPIPRPAASTETLTSKAAVFDADTTTTGTIDNRLLELTCGPYDVAGYYPGDSVLLALQLTNEGVPVQNVVISVLSCEAVKFSLGDPL